LASRYQLLDKIGEGGTSVVWRARDSKLEREVAIKLLRSFVAEDPELSRRFRREARALAALTHEHIVRIYDYASSEEQPFLVIEYVAGGNLAQVTRGQLPLTLGEAATYLEPVAQALAYAHARGVSHRDLTPSNILIERGSGRVVTTDFGLARITGSGSLTATGVLLGTPEYWSPELALGRESGAPADLYALGCVLFLLLSGRLPFQGDDRLAVGLRRAHEDPPSLRTLLPEAPEAAVALVNSLLARDPEQRPRASVVAAALGALPDHSSARPEGVDAPRDADLQTIALPSEKPTTQLLAGAATVPPTQPAPPPQQTLKSRSRWARRRALGAVAGSTAVILGALALAGHWRNPLGQVPNVVSLQESVARAQIRRSLPTATVTVQRVYSTRIGAGRVIRQRPQPRMLLASGRHVQLVVSKGTPFAPVPALTGTPAATARASLARRGFASRYAYTPSWTIRKGSVVRLQPQAGTRVRRPARVTIVVAAGYPRSVVPDVRGADLSSARQQLAANHLRSRLVWHLTDTEPGRVLDQIPAAGTSVYQGAQIRLTVARTLRWVTLFTASGSDDYESDAFTVPDRWRIRYRVAGNDFGLALAQFGWSSTDESAGHSFFANSTGALRTYVSSDGAGSYRLTIRAYAGTRWYVEVDALE
jgi:serine/threonine-protein kinase